MRFPSGNYASSIKEEEEEGEEDEQCGKLHRLPATETSCATNTVHMQWM